MTELYISNIRFSKIMLPDTELVLDRTDSFVIIQEKIQGQTVKQYITQTGCYEGILKVYHTIFSDVLELYINNSSIAVDLNLENFIIADNEIYLVDFAPPLLLQYIKRSDSLLSKLFCDRIYQLYAMNYYFCKGVILNDCIKDEERIALVSSFFSNFQFFDKSDEKDFQPFSSFMRNVAIFLKENNVCTREMVKADSFLHVIRGHEGYV